MSKLGELLEDERAKRDLTLTDFARDVLGIDHSLVSRYINGLQSPSRRTARRIAERLGLTPAQMDELLTPDESDADTLDGAKELLLDAVGDLSPETIKALATVIRETKKGGRGARARPRT